VPKKCHFKKAKQKAKKKMDFFAISLGGVDQGNAWAVWAVRLTVVSIWLRVRTQKALSIALLFQRF